jgi:DMSO/TMAO reductase YedYZ molybdopterin-dependent catalytic subunit
MANAKLTRRHFFRAGAAGLGAALIGCDRAVQDPGRHIGLELGEHVTYRAQRLLLGANRPAPEFSASDINPNFKANGTSDPPDKAYKALATNNFVDWRLHVDGLVANPLNLSLPDLRAFPTRTQITRHGEPLPVPHGAPLRLRVERQLGYKMAKYLMRIELVESYASIGGGRGGYW